MNSTKKNEDGAKKLWEAGGRSLAQMDAASVGKDADFLRWFSYFYLNEVL